jgi:hypothetical protein
MFAVELYAGIERTVTAHKTPRCLIPPRRVLWQSGSALIIWQHQKLQAYTPHNVDNGAAQIPSPSGIVSTPS